MQPSVKITFLVGRVTTPSLFRWRPFDFKAIQQCFGGRLADTALVHLRRSKPGQNNGEMMRSGPSPVVRASVSSWLNRTKTTSQPVLLVLIEETEARCSKESIGGKTLRELFSVEGLSVELVPLCFMGTT
eukprot:s78_g18.t2